MSYSRSRGSLLVPMVLHCSRILITCLLPRLSRPRPIFIFINTRLHVGSQQALSLAHLPVLSPLVTRSSLLFASWASSSPCHVAFGSTSSAWPVIRWSSCSGLPIVFAERILSPLPKFLPFIQFLPLCHCWLCLKVLHTELYPFNSRVVWNLYKIC